MAFDDGPIRREGPIRRVGAERISKDAKARARMDRDIRRAEENPHLRDHLAESERIRVGTRQHPMVLLKPLLAVVLTGALLLRSLGDASALGSTRQFFLILFGVALAWLGARWLQWTRHFFLATDQRVLKMYGVLSTTVDSMKVQKVTDMKYHRNLLGELLGYGRITIESAGQDQALHDIEYIPFPRENYQELSHIIIGAAPRTGGRKQHRFRRRLEAMSRRGQHHPEQDGFHDTDYPQIPWEVEHPEPPQGAPQATPEEQQQRRVLYSSSDGREAQTSPIPIYPPGYFAGRDDDDGDEHYHEDPTRN